MRKLTTLSFAALCVAVMATMAMANEKAPTSGAKHASGHKVTGEITAIDAGARTLSIKESVKGGTAKDMSFTIADNAKVEVHGKAGALTDIKAGDAVTLRYIMKEGKDTVEEIWVSPPAKSTMKTPKPS